MPFGIRYNEPLPAKVQSHISDIISSINLGDSDKIKTILGEWHSDDSIPGPRREDLNPVLVTSTKADNVLAAAALLNAGAEVDKIAASSAKSEAMFHCFLTHGWDINAIGQSGMPVLRHHVSDLSLLTYLLTHSADPNYTDQNTGLTLLDIAAVNAPLECVALMLNHGADVRHSSALQSAAGACPDPEPTEEDLSPEEREETNDELERVPVMQLLLKHDANINAIERMHAGEEVVGKLLAPKGARRSQRVLGTALHRAVRAGAVGRVKWLVANGANSGAVDTAGRTVFQVAESLGNRATCQSALVEL